MRLLLAGQSGFIGGRLRERLLEPAGQRSRASGNLSSGTTQCTPGRRRPAHVRRGPRRPHIQSHADRDQQHPARVGRQSRRGGDRVQWTLWGKQAENAAQYLGKGSHVNVVGRVQNSNYDKDGETVYTMAFTAEEIDTRSERAIRIPSKAPCLPRKGSRHGRCTPRQEPLPMAPGDHLRATSHVYQLWIERSRGFGNDRAIRSFWERIIQAQANRVAGSPEPGDSALAAVKEADVLDACNT